MNNTHNTTAAGRLGALLFSLLTAVGVAAAEPERLTLGVFPGVESGQAESFEILDRYLPLAKYLGTKVGAEVLLVPIKRPGNTMQRMAEGKSIYKLFFGPPVFASDAIKRADFVPLAVEQERIRAVFVVKAASSLKSVEDFVPSTRVAMPLPALLLSILANESLANRKLILEPTARKHISSNDGIIIALDSEIVDVAVIRDRAAKKLVAEKSGYRVIGQTIDAPGFALIAHKSVAEPLRNKLRQAAIGLNSDPSPLAVEARSGLRTSPFVVGRDDDFAALQRMMETWASPNKN
jgi:ABC-type phosphate/phosphonate transport system substrate-binding protein